MIFKQVFNPRYRCYWESTKSSC